jgi:serine phosphatase RsbU (regulator of sigma subunit)
LQTIDLSIVNKISRKIFYGIFLGALIVFTLYTLINYFHTKNTLVRLTDNVVERTFRSAYNQVESQVLPIITNARNTVLLIDKIYPDTSLFNILLQNTNQLFPEIFGSGLIIHSRTDNEKFSLYLPKILNGKERKFRLENYSLQPKNGQQGFYNITIKADTISLNYFYSDSLKSVYLQYDFRLSFFMNTLNRETRHLQSRHYLFNNSFEAILSPDENTNTSPESKESEDIAQIKYFLNKNQYGYFPEADLKNNQSYYLSKIRGTNLILASVMRTDEIIKQIRKFYLVAFLLTVISFAFLAYILQRIIIRLTRPLLELSKISRQIEKGKLHTQIPDYHSDQETEQLAKTLRTVQERMQKYVSSLNSTLKEKRALTKDISIAEKIQNDMLPQPDMGINNIAAVDIYCKMLPAKGVAGDFYDYFFIDDDKLFFVLGDVSGKGIPAALFMVKAITLLQVEARKGNDPGQIFTAVNEQLTFRNEEGMFVTGICGIINLKTGEVKLCDAGHHEPLTNFDSENFNYTPLHKNLPLGILIGGKPYQISTFNLRAGDTIILYSDGLPEASNVHGRMLNREPVEKILEGASKIDVTVLANKIWNLYDNFTHLAIGNDDISLFIMKYLGEDSK